MRLNDLVKNVDFINETKKKPERVCEYLESIGVKFKKKRLSNGHGADFDLIESTPNETKNLVDDILSVSEITKNFDVGYAGGTTITVRF